MSIRDLHRRSNKCRPYHSSSTQTTTTTNTITPTYSHSHTRHCTTKMRDDQAVAAQLHHLRAASHELATAAPGISAHLMSQFMALSPTTTTTTTTDRVEACAACGTIPVPGFKGNVQTKSTPTTTTVVLRCGVCQKYTEQVLAPVPPLSKPRQMRAAATATPPPSLGVTDKENRTKAKTKIKKKKNAVSSLSKMLATAAAQRQLQQQGTSRQLDLFDLMKTA